MLVDSGPFPLCPLCQENNGGLAATRHRQIHVKAAGKEACVDQGLASIIAAIWPVCDTRSCCEDEDGRAYIMPTVDTIDAAEKALVDLGLTVERAPNGMLYFSMSHERPRQPLARSSRKTGAPFPEEEPLIVTMSVTRSAIASAVKQLETHTTGIEHPRIVEARARLTVAHDWMTIALNRSSSTFRNHRGTLRPLGVALQTGLLAASCWIAASAIHSITGGSTTWTIVGGIVAVVLAAWPITYLISGAENRLGPRTVAGALRRQGKAEDPQRIAAPIPVDVLVPIDVRLHDVQAVIDAAQSAVAAIASRHLSAHRPTAVSVRAFVWLQNHDLVIRALTATDVSLRQASDAIDIWSTGARG